MHGILLRVMLTKWKFSIKIYGFWRKVFICQLNEFLNQKNFVKQLADPLKFHVKNVDQLVGIIFRTFEGTKKLRRFIIVKIE